MASMFTTERSPWQSNRWTMACRKAASAVHLTILRVSILGAMLFLPAPIRAQSVDAVSPESVERIRAALSQPPPVLRVPASSADTLTFHVEVTAPLLLLEPIDDKPFDPTFGLPSIQELVGRGVGKIGSAAVNYKRRRAQRRAQREVDDALAAFCGAQPCPTP
jgi:hypothetical protein